MSPVALRASRPRRAWAALVIFWNYFLACQRSSGVPSSWQNTRSCSCHISPRREPFGGLAGVVSAERLNRSARYRRRC